MARKMRKYADDIPFSLTSMMDMMTIILVFMIKNIDAEGQLVTQAENLILPVSTSKVQPKEVSLTVIVDNNYVLVDNSKIIETAEVLEQEDLLIAKVDSVLKERRETEKEHALTMGLPADEPGNIIVQIDKNIPYDAMYKVMATCGFSGYNNIAFAVSMKDGGEE
jgi:biopolymer transport protein ExbD